MHTQVVTLRHLCVKLTACNDQSPDGSIRPRCPFYSPIPTRLVEQTAALGKILTGFGPGCYHRHRECRFSHLMGTPRPDAVLLVAPAVLKIGLAGNERGAGAAQSWGTIARRREQHQLPKVRDRPGTHRPTRPTSPSANRTFTSESSVARGCAERQEGQATENEGDSVFVIHGRDTKLRDSMYDLWAPSA